MECYKGLPGLNPGRHRDDPLLYNTFCDKGIVCKCARVSAGVCSAL